MSAEVVVPVDWNPVFRAVQSQGKSPSPDNPKSPTDTYLAYLDKADWDVGESLWYLMFDMIPAEAALLALLSNTGDDTPPPVLPTIIFHAHGVTQKAVSDALQLSQGVEPAEGSWYALYLEKDGDTQTMVVGDLYHPNIDFIPNSVSYGLWHISMADLLALPGPPKPKTLFVRPRAPRSFSVGGKSKTRTYQNLSKVPIAKLNRFKPWRKNKRLNIRVIPPPPLPPPPPPPPPPGYGALGVMAIGQGGFNLFFDRGTREPAFYYDCGYPLPFFFGSLPPTMHVNNVAFQGPIYQNANANLSVILSHWDWDHWRFGAFVDPNNGNTLANLAWVVPIAPMSPTAANFLANLANVVNVAAGTPPQAFGQGATMFKLTPPPFAPHPFVVNNSGLAVQVPVDLAAMVAAPVMLTGDGNFNLVPAPGATLRVIGAVHHGSNNHGAAANLPAPPGGVVGEIAYSYGANPVNGNHAYGFPDANAVLAYQGAGWTIEQSTAEGPNINAGPIVAGNVRVGDQNPLPGAYLATAFAANPYQLP
jgi:hypothetical protein